MESLIIFIAVFGIGGALRVIYEKKHEGKHRK